MSRKTWLAGRAVLAIALMVSFYALALIVAFGLLWLAYEDVARSKHPAFRLIAFCVAGAGSVLWAILPRPDRFEPPGPRITAADQPDLFRVIHDVARATSQPMPHDVYLANDVNAFVAQRGGTMGFGSVRVMGLGLPLMQALTVDEFKGVLAHEFGHYHAGDVALGPWIHKTRVAMIRTIAQLSGNVLRFIFIGYASLFFRATHAVSRRQEFIADEVGAAVAGSSAMISGLRKVTATAFAYQSYWYSELVPIMQAGFRPPLMTGFGRFTARPELLSLMDGIVQQEHREGQTDPYDTHPSMRDRVAALERGASRPALDARPAAALLRDLNECERKVLGTISADLANLKPIDWPAVGAAVYVPRWDARVKQHGALLRNYTCGMPPATEQELKQIGSGIVPKEAPDEARIGAAWQLIVAAYAMALLPLGWSAETPPGEEAVLRFGAETLRPFSELGAVVSGRATPAAWRGRCAALGIDALPLGVAAPVTAGDVHDHMRGV
jgi:Zn-dependent protease with chaperone function